MTSFGNVPCDPSGVNCTATFADALYIAANPIARHTAISGWAGWGLDPTHLHQLLPSLLFAVLVYHIRDGVREPLMRFGQYCGLQKKRSLNKFQNQAYLVGYYVLSSLFGYYVLHESPFAQFPLWPSSPKAASLFADSPQAPSGLTLLYYNYQLGFYINEVFTLFTFGRRSDFLEMLAHHIFVFGLVGVSHMNYCHRQGNYIFFIHDASDIMLSVAKCLSYLSPRESIVDAGFLLFTAGFIFFRLYVLPTLMVTDFAIAARMMPCTYAYWFLQLMLHVLLQGLHVYWFSLIVAVILRTFKVKGTADGDRRTKDVRSSEDED